MRITGGKAGGRLLKVPHGLAVRPTPDLVKQALFNSLGERVVNSEVLELFAGSGALSLECLSRGARHVVAVEKSGRHAQFIRQNFLVTGFPASQCEVRTQDAFAAMRQFIQTGQSFDIILADPPYGEKNVGRRSESFAQQLLDAPELPFILRPTGLFVLGHTRRDTLAVPPLWTEHKTLKHGDTLIRFLRKSD